jgi:hypothetical protein
MNDRQSMLTFSPHTNPQLLISRLMDWWRTPASVDEAYLATATDHADLERRLRALERASRGPAFETFNH